MFATLLQNLGQLLPKYFLLASFFPMMGFVFANSAMLYWFSKGFRDFADSLVTKQGAGIYALLFAAVLIGTAMFAYVMSALTLRFRVLLEGHWGDTISRHFVALQTLRLDKMEQEIAEVIMIRGGHESSKWREKLTNARQAGEKDYKEINDFAKNRTAVSMTLDNLRKLREKGGLIKTTDLQAAVTALEQELRKNNANKLDNNGESLLDKAHQELVMLIEFAVEQARSRHTELLNRRQFDFGTQIIRPTAMGNIAETIQSYATSRFNLNLDVLWSRLQQIMSKEDKPYGGLQDARLQLDFLTNCVGLTAAWTGVWTSLFVFVGSHKTIFLLVAWGGPTLSYLWYRVAVEQYRAFADAVRATIDLSRFALAINLHLPLPSNVEEEKAAWNDLNRFITYGEDVNIRYKHVQQ